jgi:hypothetical protein
MRLLLLTDVLQAVQDLCLMAFNFTHGLALPVHLPLLSLGKSHTPLPQGKCMAKKDRTKAWNLATLSGWF